MFHPSFDAISAYADRDLTRQRRVRIAAHLRRCVACRRVLRDIRDLVKASKDLHPTDPPSDLLTRILDRRARGERVILPLTGPVGKSRRFVPVGPIAAGLAAIATSIAIVQARPPDGELQVAPSAPRPGERVTVEFHSAPGVSDLERVFLRARFRTSRDTTVGADIPEAAVTELQRQRRGEFEGAMMLPDSVVFAVLMVEDGRGGRFDGPGFGWELLVHVNGAPRYDAFVQQQRHRMPNISAALESAYRALDVYPSKVDAHRRVRQLETMAQKQRQAALVARAGRLPLLSR